MPLRAWDRQQERGWVRAQPSVPSRRPRPIPATPILPLAHCVRGLHDGRLVCGARKGVCGRTHVRSGGCGTTLRPFVMDVLVMVITMARCSIVPVSTLAGHPPHRARAPRARARITGAGRQSKATLTGVRGRLIFALDVVQGAQSCASREGVTTVCGGRTGRGGPGWGR